MNIVNIRIARDDEVWLCEYTYENSTIRKTIIEGSLTLEQAVVESIHHSELELLPEMFATSSDWGGWAIWESGPPDLFCIKE